MSLQQPVKKVFITQKWGVNKAAYEKFGLLGHNGVDYRAFLPNGERCYEGGKSEVFAPHDGTIIENYLDGAGYGWYIKIENNLEGSILAHFSNSSPLTIGQKVKQGDFVGFQGTTGNSTGIHLHWGYYPKPRDKSNGYSGTVDTEKLNVKNIGGQDMAETPLEACLRQHKELVTELDQLKPKLADLDQANKDRDRYKEERNKARKELEDMAIELSKSQENVHRLTTELETCLAGGSIVTDPPTIPGWKVNGLQVRVGDKTYNYAEE